MSECDGSTIKARGDRGYTLRGRRVEYASPALSRRSGDRARAAVRVPGGSATGNNDHASVGVVPESPAHDDVIAGSCMCGCVGLKFEQAFLTRSSPALKRCH